MCVGVGVGVGGCLLRGMGCSVVIAAMSHRTNLFESYFKFKGHNSHLGKCLYDAIYMYIYNMFLCA